jgi:hypothetical protein
MRLPHASARPACTPRTRTRLARTRRPLGRGPSLGGGARAGSSGGPGSDLNSMRFGSGALEDLLPAIYEYDPSDLGLGLGLGLGMGGVGVGHGPASTAQGGRSGSDGRTRTGTTAGGRTGSGTWGVGGGGQGGLEGEQQWEEEDGAGGEWTVSEDGTKTRTRGATTAAEVRLSGF